MRACPGATLADAGLDFCPQLSEDEVVAQLGYHPVPQHDTEGIARDAVQAGLCTKSPDMVGSFGQWLIQVRAEQRGLDGTRRTQRGLQRACTQRGAACVAWRVHHGLQSMACTLHA